MSAEEGIEAEEATFLMPGLPVPTWRRESLSPPTPVGPGQEGTGAASSSSTIPATTVGSKRCMDGSEGHRASKAYRIDGLGVANARCIICHGDFETKNKLHEHGREYQHALPLKTFADAESDGESRGPEALTGKEKSLSVPAISSGIRRLQVVEADRVDSDDGEAEFETIPDGVPKAEGGRSERKAGEAFPGSCRKGEVCGGLKELSRVGAYAGNRCGDASCRDVACKCPGRELDVGLVGRRRPERGTSSLDNSQTDVDPSGSSEGWPPTLDEIGQGKIEFEHVAGQHLNSKPNSAVAAMREQQRRRPREEVRELQALQKLQDCTRKLGVDAMSYGKGAHHAVTEVYSPPRVVDMAHAMVFKGRYSRDLTNPPQVEMAWDFSKASHRMRCWRLIKRDRPYLVIGSPQ